MALAIVGVFALVGTYLSVPEFQLPGSAYQFVNTPVYLVVILSIPLSIGMAILRSRLWDIDLSVTSNSSPSPRPARYSSEKRRQHAPPHNHDEFPAQNF
jgi:hypothetical protein